MPRPLSTLTPQLDRRLSAWDLVHHRLESHPRQRPTITVSRNFGCDGFPLAERLKELMEEASGEPWNVYDKALLELVAREQGIPVELLARLGDVSRALEAFGQSTPTHVTHDRAFAKVAARLVQVARGGNAVIVGRGGAILCHDLPGCYHFRLEAGQPWRVGNLMRRLDLPEHEAEQLVVTETRQRERFVSYALRADVADLRHYDAVFNNERHTVEEIAVAIAAYVRRAWPDRDYFRR